jgi:hypothetical protein
MLGLPPSQNGILTLNMYNLPPAGYFFLDKKVTKKSRPVEICLSSLRNSGKIPFFCGISSSTLCQQISKWPILKIRFSHPSCAINNKHLSGF